MTTLETINKDVNTELSNEGVQRALLATTFKGLDVKAMKQAIMEGMMRGFEFKDFLEKNVYAIPFRDGYSLVTSIDHARKLGMRGGVVGTSAPLFDVDKDGKIISCSLTIMKKVGDYIGDFTATVYFDEYSTGKNLWLSKPRTMIAKVAEMHALRKACPEELAQAYSEEEMHKEVVPAQIAAPNLDEFKAKLEATTTLEDLKKVWSGVPVEAKEAFKELKEELKKKYEDA